MSPWYADFYPSLPPVNLMLSFQEGEDAFDIVAGYIFQVKPSRRYRLIAWITNTFTDRILKQKLH